MTASATASDEIDGLDAASRQAANSFLERIDGMFAPSAVLVFGSRARGDNRRDSDVDLAIVLPGGSSDRWTAARAMARIAFDVLQETGIVVDPLPIWETEFAQPATATNPWLIESVLRDGRRL